MIDIVLLIVVKTKQLTSRNAALRWHMLAKGLCLIYEICFRLIYPCLDYEDALYDSRYYLIGLFLIEHELKQTFLIRKPQL